MNSSIRKKLAPILITLGACLLTACKTGNSLLDNEANITYINALDEQASFFVKKDSDSGSVYNNKYEAVSLLKHEYSESIEHEWFSIERTSFAVEDTNSKSIRTSIKTSLEDREDYWLIAWFEKNDYQLTLLKKAHSSRANVYRVRLFTNDRFKVYLNGSDSYSLITKQGEVSSFITVDDCTGLKVENNNIDLCSVDLGRSYLVVINENGLVTLAKEN